MDEDGILEAERQQIEQIRELEFEELQVEEVDGDDDSSSGDANGDASSRDFAFDTNLASLHTYLGEVEDTHQRLAFLDGGAVLTLPLLFLKGVVLFPEATLPLRLVRHDLIFIVERALTQADAPCAIGVVHICKDSDNGRQEFAKVGTTAVLRHYRRLEDGSLNVLARGQQRFCLKRHWIDVEGVSCGEVQIIQEDLPLRTPKDVLGKLAPLRNVRGCSLSHALPLNTSAHQYEDANSDSEADSVGSFERELSPAERRIHKSAIDFYDAYDTMDESTSSDDDELMHDSEVSIQRSHQSASSSGYKLLDHDKGIESTGLHIGSSSMSGKELQKVEELKGCWKNANLNQFHRVSRAFCPYWVYQMYDSYRLAERAADMWKQIVGTPSMDGLVRKPDLLSFHIASKIPASESTRQELLEIDGISYRLRREIDLLARFDLVRCRTCKNSIARRSDMLVMSSDGPLGAYVNPSGYVHEILTFHKASGLALVGRATTEYSWFPGYAWTNTTCASCETEMGWLFTATKKILKPPSFWGIRSGQVADS